LIAARADKNFTIFTGKTAPRLCPSLGKAWGYRLQEPPLPKTLGRFLAAGNESPLGKYFPGGLENGVNPQLWEMFHQGGKQILPTFRRASAA